LRGLDFSSWQALLSTVVGLSVITLIAVGIRLLVMQTIQQRRERENRQVNERLKTLIAAYKVLGGSFTGDLSVNPSHRRDLGQIGELGERSSSDRARRIRDAVESALADVILLGTEEQVKLAAHAAQELASGRHVHTADLVISLRNFIRQVLDLEAVPAAVMIPKQGPTRSAASKSGKEDAAWDESKRGGKNLDAGGASSGQGYATEDPADSHHEP
jgi:heme exporter protein D